MDLIDLARDRESWRAVLNAERTCEFHKMLGIS